MTVNTSGIAQNFASQMAIVSGHAQRKIVGLLFSWEGECTRWMLLDAEEKEILDALESKEGSRDLSIALEAVDMKRKMSDVNTSNRTETRLICESDVKKWGYMKPKAESKMYMLSLHLVEVISSLLTVDGKWPSGGNDQGSEAKRGRLDRRDSRFCCSW